MRMTIIYVEAQLDYAFQIVWPQQTTKGRTDTNLALSVQRRLINGDSKKI